MRKVVLVLSLFVALSLTGCGEPEEPPQMEEIPVTYLHTQADNVSWDNKVIEAITPCCAFDSAADKLIVYPYFDSDLSVSVEKIMLSENEFWSAITGPLEKDNTSTKKEYSLATLPNGNTIGMLPIDEEFCYWVISYDLPSGYVRAVLDALCQ